MGKELMTVYLDGDTKELIRREVAERTLNKPGEKINISLLVSQIITEYFKNKETTNG